MSEKTKHFCTTLSEKEFREVEAAIKKSKLNRHDWVVSCVKKVPCQTQGVTDEELANAKEKAIKEQEAILAEYKVSILKAHEELKKINEKLALNYFTLCKDALQAGDTEAAREYCKRIVDLLPKSDYIPNNSQRDSFDVFLETRGSLAENEK